MVNLKRIYICIVFSFIYLLFPFLGKGQQVAKKLDVADSLYRKFQLAQSIRVYQEIITDHNSPADIKLTAYLKNAELYWKFFKDADKSMMLLDSAAAHGTSTFSVEELRAKIQLETGGLDYALKLANNCLSLAKSDQEKKKAGLLYASVVLEKSISLPTASSASVPLLKKATDQLNQILDMQPGNPEASELLIGIGLLARNGKLVLSAWRSYYLVDDETKINQAVKNGYWKIKNSVLLWEEQKLTINQQAGLAKGLSESKFFRYADYICKFIRKNNPQYYSRSSALQNITSYYTYIKEVDQVNANLYPKVAREGQTGESYKVQYDSLTNAALKKLWKKLIIPAKSITFNVDAFYGLLNKEFSLLGYSGTTMDYYGMLRGHVIHREDKEINQYGFKTSFSYISVDRLISRDFTSWYGVTNVGGWGDSTSIVQVRKAYMNDPYRMLSWVTDSTERKNIQNRIKSLRETDLLKQGSDPYEEPSSVALAIKYGQAVKIFSGIDSLKISPRTKRILFVNKIMELSVAATVFAHEGRHALDQRYFDQEFKTMDDGERELRAKLSEVIFSKNPQLALTGSILGAGNDTTSPHGRANLMFRKILVNWMVIHASEIKGLNNKLPMMLQLHLLTDQQLRDLCAAADPLNKH